MTDLLYQAQPFVEGLMGICSALYVAGVIWFVAGMRKREGKNRQTPFVSVVVAARDEVERIRECLGGLVAQDYPNFEVVVVDDGSTDGTAKIVGEIAAENRLVRLLSTQEVYGQSGSKKAALSLGIDACGGGTVVLPKGHGLPTAHCGWSLIGRPHLPPGSARTTPHRLHMHSLAGLVYR